MPKRPKTIEQIKKTAIGLLDNRSTDNEGLLIKRDRKVTMLDIFGTEQKTAVAYYVSDLLAKGFNNQQIIETVRNKYGLEWTIRQVSVVKALLHKMWRCEIAHTMNDQIAREVATLDTQIKETWEAWEFSKRGISQKTTRKEDSDSEAPEMKYKVEEVVTQENTTAGDVKFLQHLNELGKEKRKLLGLYAPEKKGESQPQAVQFNLIGEGAGSEAFNMLGQILSMGTPQQQQPITEETAAEVVDSIPVVKGRDEDANIDELMAELMR